MLYFTQIYPTKHKTKITRLLNKAQQFSGRSNIIYFLYNVPLMMSGTINTLLDMQKNWKMGIIVVFFFKARKQLIEITMRWPRFEILQKDVEIAVINTCVKLKEHKINRRYDKGI